MRLSGDIAEVGITDYAQQQLGDVVFVDLPAVGTAVTAGAPFGTIESVKAVSELFAPVSGEIVEVNDRAGAGPPEDVNSRAARDVDGADPRRRTRAPDGLLDAPQYEALLA